MSVVVIVLVLLALLKMMKSVDEVVSHDAVVLPVPSSIHASAVNATTALFLIGCPMYFCRAAMLLFLRISQSSSHAGRALIAACACRA